jgi:shikimate kinase
VATGGGAVLAEANRIRLRERGFVVHLQVSVAQQIERLGRDRTRPLLAVGDKRARLESLAVEREPIYRDIADLAFDADGLSVAIAAERLGALLEQRWQRTEHA